MIAIFDIQTVVEMSAARIVDCLLEGTLIALFAGLVLRTSRRQSSGGRFAVWFSALMAIGLLPVAGSFVWREGVLAPSAVRPVVTLPDSWAFYIFATWAVIATWCLLRVGIGLWHLRALRKSCTPVDPEALDVRLRDTLERNCGRRRVALCTSERVQVPTAIGLVKPVIVIPQWLCEELSPDELNQILLHELAHLGRWDDWTNLAQQIVKALFFFHPAVWWIERKISLEREMACDDAVLAATAEPRAYAECLAHLAERTLVRRSLALAQSALGRVRQMSLRVAQILDTNCPRGTKNVWRPAVMTVTGFAIACALFAAKAPRAVAFEDVTSTPLPTIASLTNATVTMVPATLKTAVNPASRTLPSMRPGHARKFVQAKNKLPNQGVAPVSERSADQILASARNLPFSEQWRDVGHSVVIESVSVGFLPPRLASLEGAEAVSTQAVFIFVSGSRTLHSEFEIRMVRLIVFQPVRSASPEVSPKKT